MSAPNNPGPGWAPPSVGQRIDEALELIQMELRNAITYVNDAVIPQVRKESIIAMRSAAETLHNLANRFEQQAGAAPGQAANPPYQAPQGPGEPRR